MGRQVSDAPRQLSLLASSARKGNLKRKELITSAVQVREALYQSSGFALGTYQRCKSIVVGVDASGGISFGMLVCVDVCPRRNVSASPGDWAIGFRSSLIGGSLVYSPTITRALLVVFGCVLPRHGLLICFDCGITLFAKLGRLFRDLN